MFNTFRLFLFFCFLSGLLLAPAPLSAQPIRVDVQGSDVRSDYISGLQHNGDFYVSTEELAEILNSNVFQEEQLEKIVLYLDGTQVTFTAENPFFSIDDRLFQLPVEAVQYRSHIYIPIGEAAPLLDRYLPGDYAFDSVERVLTVFPAGEINITGLTVTEKENGTLVRVRATRDFGQGLQHWLDTSLPQPYLNVQFYRGRLDTLAMTNDETHGLVLNTRAFQLGEMAQLTFRLSAYTENYHIDVDRETGDILISLVKKGAASQTPPPAVVTQPESDDRIARDRRNWEIDTIVIDPGHGGKDPGTVAPNGLYEKDIVLDIALHLRTLLQESGLFRKVVLTRETDVFIPLMDRAEIAEDVGGKLFVSIHVNSNGNDRLRGFETYLLDLDKSDSALETLEVVQRENNVMMLYEEADPERELADEDLIALAMMQSGFFEESKLVAKYINEGMEQRLKWPNRGIRQADFLVLWRVPMPNVLVEAGFISNSSQRRDLRTAAVRHRIAEGIFEGIKKFKEESGR